MGSKRQEMSIKKANFPVVNFHIFEKLVEICPIFKIYSQMLLVIFYVTFSVYIHEFLWICKSPKYSHLTYPISSNGFLPCILSSHIFQNLVIISTYTKVQSITMSYHPVISTNLVSWETIWGNTVIELAVHNIW